MKKIILPILFAFVLPAGFSCSALKNASLTEADAANAIRQMLEIGVRQGIQGSFSKDAIMTTLFPESMRKTLTTLQQLGLLNDLDRFTTTMATASEKTAERSIPVFVNTIQSMSITDAIQIIKNGGTSATDYLRAHAGTQLRDAISPVMKQTLDEYKLTEQWDKLMKPAQSIAGNRINLDLPNLMAGLVSLKMFEKIEEKEKDIRANQSARTTTLLKRVFSHNWQ
ncbi:MAG: DUF4197 domain-containing protein [Flavisolibacter sp.]|nr:DUF4197 domain-containing protein [Flavisolibacter sp.]